MDESAAGIIAVLGSVIVLGAIGYRVGVKTIIDLLREVRDARRENIELHKQNMQLVKTIQRDRAKWAQEKAQMQAQIDKLIKALRMLWARNQEQREQIETLVALKEHYQNELSSRVKPTKS